MIYDTEPLIEFLDRLKERVAAGEIFGIAGWVAEFSPDGVYEGVAPFREGNIDNETIVYGATHTIHAIINGDLE